MSFLIKLYDGSLTYTGEESLKINGCSGICQSIVKGNKTYSVTANNLSYTTREEAQEAISKYNLDAEVYFYGGCGCCGIQFEDIDGSIKSVKWEEYAKTEEEKDALRYYREHIQNNLV